MMAPYPNPYLVYCSRMAEYIPCTLYSSMNMMAPYPNPYPVYCSKMADYVPCSMNMMAPYPNPYPVYCSRIAASGSQLVLCCQSSLR